MMKSYMEEKKSRIEERLSQLVHTDVKPFSTLYESMNYSLMAGGKRIRPILFLAVLDALGTDWQSYLDIACALECVHTYSLIHDDLPCMDNDDLRRGKPTNHVVYGAGQATLAGDGLLTFAFELLARQRNVEPSDMLQCIAIFAHAAGPAGMVGGQSYDLASEGNLAIGLAGLQLLHDSKTGVIFKAAIDMAAILGGAAEVTRRQLHEYAHYLGLTFQITDDILDCIGDEASLGKPVGSDERNHKATYVTIFSLERARELAKEACESAVAAIKPLGERAWFLRDLVQAMLTRIQ